MLGEEVNSSASVRKCPDIPGGPQKWHSFLVRLNFVKYWPIFKIISLSESGENLLLIVLLQIFSPFWEWNNFENRLIFDEVKAYQKLCHFWATLYTETAMNRTAPHWLMRTVAAKVHNCPQYARHAQFLLTAVCGIVRCRARSERAWLMYC